MFFVTDAVDPPGPDVDAPRRQMPLVPALITWRVERWDPLYDHWQRVVVIPTRIAVDFRSTLPHARDFWRVYARGTYQNAATFFRYHDSIGPGSYLFKLTPRAFDTHALADGTYDLVVTASDIAGNRGSLRQRSDGGRSAQSGRPPGSPRTSWPESAPQRVLNDSAPSGDIFG